MKWLKPRSGSYTTTDGTPIEVWDFVYPEDSEAFSQWARHFRNHYCPDEHIDILRTPEQTRGQYLTEVKFPTKTGGLGPATRAGDFGEILVADFLQWVRGYKVPRVRWSSKIIQNESPKGSDVVGFFLNDPNGPQTEDKLVVYEVKTKFSQSKENRLQTAINDSAKDYLRIGESLNFIKQKMLDRNDMEGVSMVGRFQNPTDNPYLEQYGAAEIISTELECLATSCAANCQAVPVNKGSEKVAPHPYLKNLELIVISGSELMKLTHRLYEVAANEA
ncbi:virulence associated protein [Ruegeria sp. A3M17]|nr:virulence associated protein [Ruegeria sp. A3M17]